MTDNKDNIDIDFNEILNDFNKLEELTRPEIQPMGIVATFKKENGWFSKDLAFLTNEEVMQWIRVILPGVDEKEYNQKSLSNRATRRQIFDNILKERSTQLFPKPPDLIGKG